LRERREDIALLVAHFLKSAAEENGKPHREFTADAVAALESYPWPGNVRELRGAIERAVVMGSGPKLTLRDLPPAIRNPVPGTPVSGSGVRLPAFRKGGNLNVEDTEQRLIVRALEETGGNVTEAAKRLGMSRRTLHRRLKEMRHDENPSPSPGTLPDSEPPDHSSKESPNPNGL
jgi:DNA-binding NtrC family response regulator